MLKQSIGMTENNAKQIAEMYLSRYNPTYWDGSGKVPSEVIFEICRVAVDSMYNGYLYNVADKLWYAADTVQDNSFFVLDENFINAHT